MELDLLKDIRSDLRSASMTIEEFAELSKKQLYPRQLLLLKLIFLEELTQEEEDTLDFWIRGGNGGDEIQISPLIRERIAWLREHQYPHFNQIVLVGGRRSGKGHITGTAMAYKMNWVSRMSDPAVFFGIDDDKEIYFDTIAVSQDQAKRHQYADFTATMGSYLASQGLEGDMWGVRELEFSVMTPKDKLRLESLKAKGVRVKRDISKLRARALAANARTVRGSATLVAALDEMAWMQQEGESYMTAAQVYDALTPSINMFGKWSMIFTNSSPYTKLGKFYELFTQGMMLQDNEPLLPNMLVMKFPSWALYETWQGRRYPRRLLEASPDWDPEETDAQGQYVYAPEDRDAIIRAKYEEQQDPDKFKVEKRSNWADVMDSFLRPEAVDRAFLGRPGPNESYTPIQTNWSYPVAGYNYVCHLDPSATTAGFGFALGHIENIKHQDPITGEESVRAHVVFDIIQRWQAKSFPDGVVDYEVVLDEISLYLKIFRPTEVSVDQFSSQAIQAWLKKYMREHELGSTRVIERTAGAQSNYNVASSFRDALYMDLVHIPSDTGDCDWLGKELKSLQVTNTAGRFPKIDCPTIGPVTTKDLWSASSHVVYALIGDLITAQVMQGIGKMKPSLGSPHGYRIGGPAGDALAAIYGPKALGNFKRSEVPSARERLNALSAARNGTWSVRGRKR